jgi:hypothetical protein
MPLGAHVPHHRIRGVFAPQARLFGMRKQYFFRPSANGFDAWDVDRLIELSKSLPTFELPIDSISEIDTPYWFGVDGGPMTVRTIVLHLQLVNEVDVSYPIILGADGQVMDGMHRVARALLEGRTTLSAVRFELQPEPDHRDVLPANLSYER